MSSPFLPLLALGLAAAAVYLVVTRKPKQAVPAQEPEQPWRSQPAAPVTHVQTASEVAEEDALEIIQLTDEEGIKHDFYFYDSIELDGKTYVLLLPVDEAEDEDEPEMLVLRQDPTVQDGLMVIDDEDEFNRVVAALQAEAEEDED